ncbi:hypothetical protein AVDCRST_MAG81-3696 [uncultured Synechococcales cyanobacterium]|uniref:Uncharacterized protein n=1 Tax=uncultured Synechococcales cyanobacterium TaxID=1936017 RepID=A0A6J4VL13_9CYAN|nr:hypothetical protein AVDCRST_MAG81-3696 [uncultured Synechococcales cyanobacterium]
MSLNKVPEQVEMMGDFLDQLISCERSNGIAIIFYQTSS